MPKSVQSIAAYPPVWQYHCRRLVVTQVNEASVILSLRVRLSHSPRKNGKEESPIARFGAVTMLPERCIDNANNAKPDRSFTSRVSSRVSSPVSSRVSSPVWSREYLGTVHTMGPVRMELGCGGTTRWVPSQGQSQPSQRPCCYPANCPQIALVGVDPIEPDSRQKAIRNHTGSRSSLAVKRPHAAPFLVPTLSAGRPSMCGIRGAPFEVGLHHGPHPPTPAPPLLSTALERKSPWPQQFASARRHLVRTSVFQKARMTEYSPGQLDRFGRTADAYGIGIKQESVVGAKGS